MLDSKQTLSTPPTLTMLGAFVSAVEAGSFAAAARKLGVTPAALGQSVRRLEEFLGVRLLNRTTRRMHPTSDGHRLAARLRGPLTELEEACRELEEGRSRVSGVLRISAPPGLGRRHVLPLAASFRARFPAIHFDLDFTDAIRDFAGGELDLAFRILRPVDSSIVARPISRLDAVTVASPEYLRRVAPPNHPRDLSAHDQVAYRHPVNQQLAPHVFRIGGRDVRFQPRPTVVVNDVDAGCEAIAQGLGIGQPPSDYAAPYLASGRLVEVLRPYRAAPWRLYLCYPAARRLPLRVKAFVDFALEALGRERLRA